MKRWDDNKMDATSERINNYLTAYKNRWICINDIRMLENMEPIEKGDVYFIPDYYIETSNPAHDHVGIGWRLVNFVKGRG